MSPLLGECSPAILRRIPGTEDILALWTYGYAGRTPLVSAISSDGGKTWKHLKLIEQSRYHAYCYASCVFRGDRVYLSYMHFPLFSSRFRFEAEPGYIDYRFVSLPLAWFYRKTGRD
ncbi:MAG: glycoside hydrolase [Pirellulales bacterium]|nr:glycoside hydrolase [Pirellulales bacterium]